MINNIVIIEDEKLNADRIKRLVGAIRPNVSVLGVIDSVADGIKWFKANVMPDVILMDVRLIDGLSFEIFKEVEINCPVIFTTAYDEYAVNAFKHNGVDYLLKPVEQDELEQAIKKVEKVANPLANQDMMAGLMAFLKPKEFRSRFLIPYRDSYKTILTSEIACIYTEFKSTRALLTDGAEIVLLQKMEELEEQLDPKYFFRANRQFIIHIDAVLQIHNYHHGKLKVVIKNCGAEIIVSRDKASLLKLWMGY
ncbi:LytTR family DNA-binding domain-containing protein [Pedobacter nototheniae]|uniref:LytR/AlgR family response regulator transcription factor n=1 Tax=Pedobacter nototheniae TaxID=2488994 RepID=UPI00292D4418|nr:LytTR family DNA-binding domain-containing protein [Pedobacter nototheniae]